MEQNTTSSTLSGTFIFGRDLLDHWQGHRKLTRKVIEVFPENDFFNFQIGGMRPFSEMVLELLAIAGPGMKEIATGEAQSFSEEIDHQGRKEHVLALWDTATTEIDNYWNCLESNRFGEHVKLFGQYEGTVYSSILYFVDNEVHHRGQAYVYLRALGIEPPAFWDR